MTIPSYSKKVRKNIKPARSAYRVGKSSCSIIIILNNEFNPCPLIILLFSYPREIRHENTEGKEREKGE